MSLDNQYSANTGNLDSLQPKKSGALKWILGGCGCLGLLAVLCFGGLIWFGVSKAGKVTQEARSFVENSTVVQKHLGSPVVIKAEAHSQGEGQSLVFRFDVSGPNGNGQATVNATFDEEAFDFVLGESSLDVDGEVVDLNAQGEFDVNIEGLD